MICPYCNKPAKWCENEPIEEANSFMFGFIIGAALVFVLSIIFKFNYL